MFHHHTNDNDLLYGPDCNASEVLHGFQLRQWIFPVSSGYPCEFPWWIIWLAKVPFDKTQKRNYLPSFFLFQFLQLYSSRSSLRGHLKWAISFFYFMGSLKGSTGTVREFPLCPEEQRPLLCIFHLWKGSRKISCSRCPFLPNLSLSSKTSVSSNWLFR